MSAHPRRWLLVAAVGVAAVLAFLAIDLLSAPEDTATSDPAGSGQAGNGATDAAFAELPEVDSTTAAASLTAFEPLRVPVDSILSLVETADDPARCVEAVESLATSGLGPAQMVADAEGIADPVLRAAVDEIVRSAVAMLGSCPTLPGPDAVDHARQVARLLQHRAAQLEEHR